jgi:hypothetical protein
LGLLILGHHSGFIVGFGETRGNCVRGSLGEDELMEISDISDGLFWQDRYRES